MTIDRLSRIAVAILLWLGISLACFSQDYPNSMLPWHDAVLDSQHKLVPWFQSESGQAFDHVMHLGWDYIEHKIPIDAQGTGAKIYLINSVFDPNTQQGIYWQHNPASTYGQFVDSLVAWYPYSGDREAIDVIRAMLDYQLAHGTTPADWDWSSVPFATGCGNEAEYGRCLQ